MCPLTSCTRCTLFQLECGGFLCLNILGPTSIGFFPKKQIISNNSTFVRAKTSNHWEFLPKQHQVGSWGFSSWAFSLPPKRKQPPPIFFLVPTVDGEIFPSKQCPRGTNKDWICATGSAKISALTSSSPRFFFCYKRFGEQSLGKGFWDQISVVYIWDVLFFEFVKSCI